MRRNTALDVRRIAWEVALDAVRPHGVQAAIGERVRQLVRDTAHEAATEVTRQLLAESRVEASEVREIAGTHGKAAGTASARAALEDVRSEGRSVLRVVRTESGAAIAEVRTDSRALLAELREGSGSALRELREGTGSALSEMRQRATAVGEEVQETADAALAEVRKRTDAALEEAGQRSGAALREVRDGADTALREVGERAERALREVGEARREATAAIEELTRESDATVRGLLDEGREALLEFARVEAAGILAEVTPPILEVVLPEGESVRLVGHRHQVLPDVLTALHARCHVLLVGPAGTGKSMLAKQVAETLGLEFQALSLGPTTPMSKIFGYYDANGHYHDTPFRRAFEQGGLMLLDELDSGHPGLLAELNQALSIGTCAFADGMVTAHRDFRLVATANTFGTGGDRQYVGRQALDAATLDRFLVIEVPVDEELEEKITLAHAPSRPVHAREVLDEVRRLRAVAAEKRLPVMFSPRASIDAAKLLQAGASVEQAIRWRIVRGMSAAHRAALGVDP
ncbi:AAA family ATPase [Streptomyces profundus]|uniref:AAA family ATPase n=1 Tax=Streptomyces profundus TaxID=2867410 RepID=UPI001D16EB0A|nr:AAA family ATPase [Streptomyces sp. MA3_2.13]UED84698.1 AAA family ATPase [Streptomyces sp. MA3_2.13]